jgi:hypothetical protein
MYDHHETHQTEFGKPIDHNSCHIPNIFSLHAEPEASKAQAFVNIILRDISDSRSKAREADFIDNHSSNHDKFPSRERERERRQDCPT